MLILVAGAVFIALRLAGIQQHKQTAGIRVIGVIHNRIDQPIRGDRRVIGKVAGSAKVKRYRIRSVLQATIADGKIDIGHSAVAEHEETIGICLPAVQIKSCVRGIAAAIEQHHDHAVQTGVAKAAIIKLDEFKLVVAGRI